MLSTIAIFASSRRNGNTGRLIDDIAARLGIDVIDLTQKNLSAYDYEHRNRDDDFEPLMDSLLGFEQVIFASPVYWYSVAPPMKVFLDRISDLLELPDLLDKGRQLRSKCAFVVTTSIYDQVPSPFLGAFQETFNYLGMRYGGCMHANCREGYVSVSHQRELGEFVDRVRSP